MGSVAKPTPRGTRQLSNRLADLAERAGDAARAYRRGSIEAIGQYLRAGALLAEARGECRRGEWGAVLDRAGIGRRAGRDLVRVARAVAEDGVTAEDLHAAGGVRAWMMARANPKAMAIAGALAYDPEPEKPALGAGSASQPPPAEPAETEGETSAPTGRSPAVVHETPPAQGEPRSMRESAPMKPMSLYAWRRCQSLCVSCAEPTDGSCRCPRCAALVLARRRAAAARAKLGSALEPRLREAADRGRGVRLSAEEVARILESGR